VLIKRKLGSILDRSNVALIMCNGKDEIPKVVKFFQTLGISCAVACDEDAKKFLEGKHIDFEDVKVYSHGYKDLNLDLIQSNDKCIEKWIETIRKWAEN